MQLTLFQVLYSFTKTYPSYGKMPRSQHTALSSLFPFCPCLAAYGVLVPQPGIRLGRLQCKCGVLATGPPGSSHSVELGECSRSRNRTSAAPRGSLLCPSPQAASFWPFRLVLLKKKKKKKALYMHNEIIWKVYMFLLCGFFQHRKAVILCGYGWTVLLAL